MVLTVRKLRCTNDEILKKRLHLKLASCVNIVLALFFQQNGAPVDYTNTETDTAQLNSTRAAESLMASFSFGSA